MPRVSGSKTGRNAELGLLAFAMAIVAFFSASAEANLLGKITSTFWVPTALLGAMFLGLHVVVRFVAPYADPVLIPAVALINGLGCMFLRRLEIENAVANELPIPGVFGATGGKQLLWTLIALGLAAGLLLLLRDHKVVSRYAYTLGLVGIVLVMIPAVLPAKYSEVNGAKLWIKFGSSFSIQPGEFAKLALVSFFAYYLVRKREVLSLASRRVLGIDFPRGRDLGPVITVWMLSLLVLVFVKDLGTALMYFGLFVVTLYTATERSSWLIIGLLMFFGGVYAAYLLGAAVGGPFLNFYDRATIWLDPFASANYEREYGGSYQLVQSLLGLGTGGLFGTGPGAGSPFKVPEVRTDMIFSGMGEEIGLFGLTALLVCYLLVVERGLRAALGVRDSFGKLVAGGMAFTLGLQLFVILGGITGLIPLTGQTTPFLSAGGSSLMANWLLIGVLLRISNSAREPLPGGGASQSAGPGPKQPPAQLHGAMTEVIKP